MPLLCEIHIFNPQVLRSKRIGIIKENAGLFNFMNNTTDDDYLVTCNLMNGKL